MAFRIRSTKFRHVYGDAYKKPKCYENIKITKTAHDTQCCSLNPKFIALIIECAGGGAFVVLPINQTGRVDINTPKVCGHRGPVMDIKWNPFDDNVIASSSEDSTVKIWRIPTNGLTENLESCIVDLRGHQKRVSYIEWHPTTADVLLSTGYDFRCIIWNVKRAEPITIIDNNIHGGTIFSICWSYDGSQFCTSCKDKTIRVFDARSGALVNKAAGHQGTKASKVLSLKFKDRLFTTGFSKMSERQIAVWDLKDMSKPLKMENVDSSNGVMIPFYDPDTGVVFLAGKGDGNIRYYEITNEAPYIFFLNQYSSGFPHRSLGYMPKRGIDPLRCEIARFYKLYSTKDYVEPISMIVPRKLDGFQEDIFPPTQSSCASLTVDEWLTGMNRQPILMSLKSGLVDTANVITTYQSSDEPMIDSCPPAAHIPASIKNIQRLSSQSQQICPQDQVNNATPVRPSTGNIEKKIQHSDWSSNYVTESFKSPPRQISNGYQSTPQTSIISPKFQAALNTYHTNFSSDGDGGASSGGASSGGASSASTTSRPPIAAQNTEIEDLIYDNVDFPDKKPKITEMQPNTSTEAVEPQIPSYASFKDYNNPFSSSPSPAASFNATSTSSFNNERYKIKRDAINATGAASCDEYQQDDDATLVGKYLNASLYNHRNQGSEPTGGDGSKPMARPESNAFPLPKGGQDVHKNNANIRMEQSDNGRRQSNAKRYTNSSVSDPIKPQTFTPARYKPPANKRNNSFSCRRNDADDRSAAALTNQGTAYTTTGVDVNDSKQKYRMPESQREVYTRNEAKIQPMKGREANVQPIRSSNENLQSMSSYEANLQQIKPSNENFQSMRSSKENLQPMRSYEANLQQIKPSNENFQPMRSSKENLQPMSSYEANLQQMKTREVNSQPIKPSNENFQSMRSSKENLQPMSSYEANLQQMKPSNENFQPMRSSKENLQQMSSYEANLQQMKTREVNSQPIKPSNENFQSMRSSKENLQPMSSYEANLQQMKPSNENFQPMRSSKENLQQMSSYEANLQQMKTREVNSQPIIQANLQQMKPSNENLQPMRSSNENFQPMRSSNENFHPVKPPREVQRPTVYSSSLLGPQLDEAIADLEQCQFQNNREIKKTWSPIITKQDDFDNCVAPNTDSELRRLYFEQLKVIKNLKNELFDKVTYIGELESQLLLKDNNYRNARNNTNDSHC